MRGQACCLSLVSLRTRVICLKETANRRRKVKSHCSVGTPPIVASRDQAGAGEGAKKSETKKTSGTEKIGTETASCSNQTMLVGVKACVSVCSVFLSPFYTILFHTIRLFAYFHVQLRPPIVPPFHPALPFLFSFPFLPFSPCFFLHVTVFACDDLVQALFLTDNDIIRLSDVFV